MNTHPFWFHSTLDLFNVAAAVGGVFGVALVVAGRVVQRRHRHGTDNPTKEETRP